MNIKAIFFLLSVFSLAQILSACSSNVAPAASIPTIMPTPTIDPRQSAEVVRAFWAALEAKDLEAALVYVDEEATCAGNCYFTGKSTFRSFLQGYLDRGYITKISDVKNVGSIVTYSWEVYRNGNFIQSGRGDEVMQVENGKIVYWENQHR
jgi:limonene-1,2-epoxide hydrolase